VDYQTELETGTGHFVSSGHNFGKSEKQDIANQILRSVIMLRKDGKPESFPSFLHITETCVCSVRTTVDIALDVLHAFLQVAAMEGDLKLSTAKWEKLWCLIAFDPVPRARYSGSADAERIMADIHRQRAADHQKAAMINRFSRPAGISLFFKN
jgi:hypothetical protein